LFPNYFIATVTPYCQVQHVSDTFVFLTITLIVICFFYTLKSWHLDFPCTGLLKMIVGVLTICHTQYTWDSSM